MGCFSHQSHIALARCRAWVQIQAYLANLPVFKYQYLRRCEAERFDLTFLLCEARIHYCVKNLIENRIANETKICFKYWRILSLRLKSLKCNRWRAITFLKQDEKLFVLDFEPRWRRCKHFFQESFLSCSSCSNFSKEKSRKCWQHDFGSTYQMICKHVHL